MEFPIEDTKHAQYTDETKYIEYSRNIQKCGKYYGDSIVNAISRYPLVGSVKTIDDLLKLVNNSESVEHWLRSENINYILYYNPYMINTGSSDSSEEAAGLFNYFGSLTQAANYLARDRPKQKLTQYFQKDRAFFSFHIYKILKKGKNLPGWGLKILSLDYLDKIKPDMISSAELHNLSVIKYKKSLEPSHVDNSNNNNNNVNNGNNVNNVNNKSIMSIMSIMSII